MSRRAASSAFAALLGLGTLVAGPPASAAEATPCNGFQTGGTFPGDVVVHAGAVCDLDGVEIMGNVTVEAGGYFDVTDSAVHGSVSGTDASVRVWSSHLDGHYAVTRPKTVVPNLTAAILRNSTVGGSVSVQLATGGTTIVLGCAGCGTNTIAGNLISTNNAVPAPYLHLIHGNVVGGSLVCSGNTPPPAVGANVVTGATYGQCAAP